MLGGKTLCGNTTRTLKCLKIDAGAERDCLSLAYGRLYDAGIFIDCACLDGFCKTLKTGHN